MRHYLVKSYGGTYFICGKHPVFYRKVVYTYAYKKEYFWTLDRCSSILHSMCSFGFEKNFPHLIMEPGEYCEISIAKL